VAGFFKKSSALKNGKWRSGRGGGPHPPPPPQTMSPWGKKGWKTRGAGLKAPPKVGVRTRLGTRKGRREPPFLQEKGEGPGGHVVTSHAGEAGCHPVSEIKKGLGDLKKTDKGADRISSPAGHAEKGRRRRGPEVKFGSLTIPRRKKRRLKGGSSTQSKKVPRTQKKVPFSDEVRGRPIRRGKERKGEGKTNGGEIASSEGWMLVFRGG